MKTFVQTLFFFLLVTQICFAQWVQTSGPDNMVVNAFVASGMNFFAGTSTGVFLSTDNGLTWTEANNGLTETDVHSLTISGTTLFAGTCYGGVFISSDNGYSWTESDSGLPSGSSSCCVNSLAASGENIFAGTEGNGVFLSTNNGISWSAVNSGLTSQSASVANVYALAISDSNLFAGTGEGIFLSTNNGTNWHLASEGLPKSTYDSTRYGRISSFALFHNESGGTNIFAGTEDGVFLSTNNGNNWTAANSGISENAAIDHLSVSTNNSGGTTLVASSSSYGIYHFDGVYLSTNSGVDWIQIGLTNVRISALAITENEANGTNILAGTYGGMYFSSNNGVDWSFNCFNNPNSFSNITALAISDMNIIAGIDEGIPFDFHGPTAIFISLNNGDIWRPKYCSTDCTIHAFTIVPDDNAATNIFCGTSDGVLHSTNNGNTWDFVNDGLTNYNVQAIGVSGSNIFAGTWWGGVFMSTNNGTNWNMVDTVFTEDLRAFVASDTNLFVGAGNGVYGTQPGGIFRSTNNGSSWTSVNSGLTNIDVHALCISRNETNDINIFAGTSGGIFRSSNNGTNWQAVNTGLTNSDVYCFAVSGTNIFAGTRGGVFLSTNNGSSWTEVNEGLMNTNISALAVNADNIFAGTSTVWYSGPIGQGIWRRALSEVITSIDEFSLEIPKNFILYQNFPNPFNPTTKIKYTIPNYNGPLLGGVRGGLITLKVYDVLGREAATLVNETKQPGEYEVEFNAANLPSGVYFYQLKVVPFGRQAGEFISTRKMILIK